MDGTEIRNKILWNRLFSVPPQQRRARLWSLGGEMHRAVCGSEGSWASLVIRIWVNITFLLKGGFFGYITGICCGVREEQSWKRQKGWSCLQNSRSLLPRTDGQTLRQQLLRSYLPIYLPSRALALNRPLLQEDFRAKELVEMARSSTKLN